MDEKTKPHLVGVNHIALEVGNIDEALAFYARIFTFELRGRGRGAAFIDMGDQFIALTEGRSQGADDDRQQRARRLSKAIPWTFSTHGATVFKSSNTAICNSRRRPPC